MNALRAVVAFASLVFPTFAYAGFCAPGSPQAPHAMMLQTLEQRWREKVVENATIRDGGGGIIGVFEITASEAGTWTALATSSDGMACIMAAGGDYSGVQMKKGRET